MLAVALASVAAAAAAARGFAIDAVTFYSVLEFVIYFVHHARK